MVVSGVGVSVGSSSGGRSRWTTALSPTWIASAPRPDSGPALICVAPVINTSTLPWFVPMVMDEPLAATTGPERDLRVSWPGGVCPGSAASTDEVVGDIWESPMPSTETNRIPITIGLITHNGVPIDQVFIIFTLTLLPSKSTRPSGILVAGFFLRRSPLFTYDVRIGYGISAY